MKTFYQLLGVALLVVTTNNFVWFALTFWAYLTTQSVISTSVMAGIFLVLTAVSGFWFGSIVDHHKKKHAMLGSSVATLVLFLIGLALFHTTPASAVRLGLERQALGLRRHPALRHPGRDDLQHRDPDAGRVHRSRGPARSRQRDVRNDDRDRVRPHLGGERHLAGLRRNGVRARRRRDRHRARDRRCSRSSRSPRERSSAPRRPSATLPTDAVRPRTRGGKASTSRGTIRAVKAVPGLFALIFFTTFNNFLGGVFFALMDAYGLSLVSVEVWGTLWGVLSLSFILGGLYISKKGLGANPAAHPLPQQHHHLDGVHLLHDPALDHAARGRDVRLDVLRSVHRGDRADHLPEGGPAGAARPRVRVRPLGRAGRLAHHRVPDRAHRAVDLHSVHDDRRRASS